MSQASHRRRFFRLSSRSAATGLALAAALAGCYAGVERVEEDSDPRAACDAMDARDLGAACTNVLLGWTWDGTVCEPVYCDCAGVDCSSLYATEGDCIADRSECLAPPQCEQLGWGECEARSDCGRIWYGGGCINTDDCSHDGEPQLCWEQGAACVPVADPCFLREYVDCTGDCYWRDVVTVVTMGACPVNEGYSYCARIPGG